MLTFTSRIVKIPSCTCVTYRKVVESRCTCITFVIHEIEFTTTYPIFITFIAIWSMRITITSWNVKNKVKKVTLSFLKVGLKEVWNFHWYKTMGINDYVMSSLQGIRILNWYNTLRMLFAFTFCACGKGKIARSTYDIFFLSLS